MTIQAIQLADGRTTVELDLETGELTERGASFPVLHRPVDDSLALFRLLYTNRQAIAKAYNKAHTQDTNTLQIGTDGLLSESGPKVDTQSSIQIDDELKHDTGLIHKSRGA